MIGSPGITIDSGSRSLALSGLPGLTDVDTDPPLTSDITVEFLCCCLSGGTFGWGGAVLYID